MVKTLLDFFHVWGMVLKELGTPSDYRNDWLRWGSGQCTHTFFGLMLVFIAAKFSVWATGELAYKYEIFWFVAAMYLGKELVFDKYMGFDTIEDVLFFVGYGAGGTLLHFSVSEERLHFVYVSTLSTCVVLTFFTHLAYGVYIRAERQYRE